MAFFVIVVAGCGGDVASVSDGDDATLIGIVETRPDWAIALNSEVSTDPCDWVGITCSNDTITGIDLAEDQLTGEIPPELADLTNLITLDLSQNQLTGEIPPELGNLTNLERFMISDTQLTGEIPPELEGVTER